MLNNIEALNTTFSTFAKINIDSYLKSLPYFLLTGRKGFYFFRDKNTSLSVTAHPHSENTLIVFPEYDGDGELTVSLLNHLAEKEFNVQLGRYTQEDYNKLSVALNKDKRSRIKSIQIKAEDILDWRYPSRILETKAIAELSGKKFDTIRNKFNKSTRDSELKTVPLSDPEALKIMQSTIFHWLAGLAFLGRETGEDVSGFYQTLLQHIKDFPNFFDGFVTRTKKEAVGFTIWDITGDTANALAGLNKRSIAGMSEFQTVTACRMLNEKGIKRYNLGGSETKSLDKFKLKFHPVDSIQLFSCDVEFNNEPNLSFETLNVIHNETLNL
jgi:hypothetical protein